MKQYLWEYSFDELFFAEGGREILAEANAVEAMKIETLKQYFETQAKHCCSKFAMLNQQTFHRSFPQLLHTEMTMQLCLLYSLTIFENQCDPQEIIDHLQQDTLPYFYEYRNFDQQFKFEALSLMNQIAPLQV